MSRILVIEDEAVIRGALRRLLERNGYEVLEAASVEDAREIDELDDTDLVIADLRLPGDPGTAAIGLVPHAPVLIMTSFASVRSAVDSMKLGAVDYVAKPFNHDEMLLSVERVLGVLRQALVGAPLGTDLGGLFGRGNLTGQQ